MADYYGTWKEDTYVCDKCSWEGTGEQCTQGEMFKDLFEINCPSCQERLDVVLYPTIEESCANWDKVSDQDKIIVLAHEQLTKDFETKCLNSPEELPDVDGDHLVFVWDFIWDDYLAIIRFGEKVIWREPAFYEGYTRFREVAIILKEKYGERLKDLAPAQRSYNALLGDSFSADETIQMVRNWVGQGNLCDLPPEKVTLQRVEKSRNNNEVKSDSNKTTFGDTRSTQSLSNLPRLYTTKQLPEIKSDDDLVLVWDEIESENSPQIAIRYGNTIIWKEYSYFGCFNRFEPIAILLQQKYGAKLKDLIPTRSSEINLYGDQRNAEGIVSGVQGNIWMSRYAPNP